MALFNDEGSFICPDIQMLPEYYHTLLAGGDIKSVFSVRFMTRAYFPALSVLMTAGIQGFGHLSRSKHFQRQESCCRSAY